MADHDHDRSRRDFLRQAGTVAWAAPLILTMAAPSAHAQTSCIPAGSPCGNDVNGICIPSQTFQSCCGECVPSQNGIGCFCVDV
jgi:hypothetical protein